MYNRRFCHFRQNHLFSARGQNIISQNHRFHDPDIWKIGVLTWKDLTISRGFWPVECEFQCEIHVSSANFSAKSQFQMSPFETSPFWASASWSLGKQGAKNSTQETTAKLTSGVGSFEAKIQTARICLWNRPLPEKGRWHIQLSLPTWYWYGSYSLHWGTFMSLLCAQWAFAPLGRALQATYSSALLSCIECACALETDHVMSRLLDETDPFFRSRTADICQGPLPQRCHHSGHPPPPPPPHRPAVCLEWCQHLPRYVGQHHLPAIIKRSRHTTTMPLEPKLRHRIWPCKGSTVQWTWSPLAPW